MVAAKTGNCKRNNNQNKQVHFNHQNNLEKDTATSKSKETIDPPKGNVQVLGGKNNKSKTNTRNTFNNPRKLPKVFLINQKAKKQHQQPKNTRFHPPKKKSTKQKTNDQNRPSVAAKQPRGPFRCIGSERLGGLEARHRV